LFIRWKIRAGKKAITCSAYLVESKRDGRDKPRQKILCFLGSIRQPRGLQVEAFAKERREMFARKAHARLERLNIDALTLRRLKLRAGVVPQIRPIPHESRLDPVQLDYFLSRYERLIARGGPTSEGSISRLLDSF
jgi:hypothetical protein